MDETLKSAVDWLLEHQDPGGWWCGELETNVTMTAEHVLLLRFLDIPLDSIRDGAMVHILKNQREDGSWGNYYNAPADLSTTIEAYVALKVLGVDPTSQPMLRALKLIHRLGGVASARVFTKMWVALFGAYPWDGIPSMPPELVYLPASVPFNLYDFACWARGTIAPLLIVLTKRPVRPLGCDLRELIVPGTEAQITRVPGSGFFWWTDRLLKLYDRFPVHPKRNAACAEIADWIVQRQETDGSWGGIQPPWVYSLIALNLEGMAVDHPIMLKGLRGLNGFGVEDEEGWRLQACMSPVWDTVWVMQALARSGLKPDHPAVRQSVDWILREQITGGGDWQIKVPNVECGGWAFEFDNDIYPDIDDTAVVVVSLLDAGERKKVQPAIDRAVRWVIAMQSSNQGWAAFDRDNTNDRVYSIPFADFGALIDPPSEDVTAHVIEMLARTGNTPADRKVAEGLAYLRRTQQPDGSWFGRWGVNHIYGTWCVISALHALYGSGDRLPGRAWRAIRWLLDRQNADGGWGETCHSYVDTSFAGIGTSAPSQTAWAVMSLQYAGLGQEEACLRGLNFLRDRQIGGTWDEPQFTGTGFPRDFYINYHLYRHVFPTMALASEHAGIGLTR